MSIIELAQWRALIAWVYIKLKARRFWTQTMFLVGNVYPGVTVVKVPFGGLTLTLRGDFYVIFDDGSSQDAVPLNWCQPGYVEVIVKAMGYNPSEVIEYNEGAA